MAAAPPEPIRVRARATSNTWVRITAFRVDVRDSAASSRLLPCDEREQDGRGRARCVDRLEAQIGPAPEPGEAGGLGAPGAASLARRVWRKPHLTAGDVRDAFRVVALLRVAHRQPP